MCGKYFWGEQDDEQSLPNILPPFWFSNQSYSTVTSCLQYYKAITEFFLNTNFTYPNDVGFWGNNIFVNSIWPVRVHSKIKASHYIRHIFVVVAVESLAIDSSTCKIVQQYAVWSDITPCMSPYWLMMKNLTVKNTSKNAALATCRRWKYQTLEKVMNNSYVPLVSSNLRTTSCKNWRHHGRTPGSLRGTFKLPPLCIVEVCWQP